jgi:hypothetical protein
MRMDADIEFDHLEASCDIKNLPLQWKQAFRNGIPT